MSKLRTSVFAELVAERGYVVVSSTCDDAHGPCDEIIERDGVQFIAAYHGNDWEQSVDFETGVGRDRLLLNEVVKRLGFEATLSPADFAIVDRELREGKTFVTEKDRQAVLQAPEIVARFRAEARAKDQARV